MLSIFLILSLAGCATTTPSVPARSSSTGSTYQKFQAGGDSFIWPVTGVVISRFGEKVDYTKNKGIDIRASSGTSVRASRAGRVVFFDEKFKGFGKTVILDHGDSYQTVYAYNFEVVVRPGDAVKQNEVIAIAGKSGRAKEASLHFEIRKNGKPEDPSRYLR